MTRVTRHARLERGGAERAGPAGRHLTEGGPAAHPPQGDLRLMTPRPIRNEDGRDVRGRRGGKAEARTKRGVAAGRLLVGLISCGKNKRY
ncbi:hypothetical protein NDU88_000218 [Pleurodeles waltl]|uniref:Uncharacterized protein n=1 Tax=Pleurodeles waltl TaxID=8319 RepID=A0AAV7U4C1_PLEWA|nr:hypothetical protein NDU88_000218 [Pleurodeles waltl]